jgi:glycosyltransferase involved in cell wall biosynthesis
VDQLTDVGAEMLMNLWTFAHLPDEQAPRLAKWVNAQQDVVYVVSISPDVGWLALPLLNSDIPTLSIAHNDVGAFYLPVAHYAPLLDCAIGVSLEITRRLREETGLPSERVRYIPYGVPRLSEQEAELRVASGRDSSDPLRIGYVGRMVQDQKRVREFLPLARELKNRSIPFELHLIGDGDERLPLEQRIKAHGLETNVKFWGWLSPVEVKRRLAELDVFALLSDHEGLPVALLEAMGQTLLPVVTRINSGNTQLIRNGENGLLFAVGDITACADHLTSLAADRNLLLAMRRAAWDTTRDYSVPRMIENYEECFRHLKAADFSRAHRAGAPQPYPILPACRSRYPFWLRKVKSRLINLRSFQAQTTG